MLASSPASMVNQKRLDLGIPNRFKVASSRFNSSGPDGSGGLGLINFANGEFGVNLNAGVGVPDETIGSDNITQYLPPNNLTIQTSSGPMPAELGPVYAKWTRDPSDNDTSLVDPNVLDGPKGQILDINDYLKPGGGGGGGGGGDGGAGFPNVSASAFVADQSSLDFRKNGFQVSDTAQNVSGVID